MIFLGLSALISEKNLFIVGLKLENIKLKNTNMQLTKDVADIRAVMAQLQQEKMLKDFMATVKQDKIQGPLGPIPVASPALAPPTPVLQM